MDYSKITRGVIGFVLVTVTLIVSTLAYGDSVEVHKIWIVVFALLVLLPYAVWFGVKK